MKIKLLLTPFILMGISGSLQAMTNNQSNSPTSLDQVNMEECSVCLESFSALQQLPHCTHALCTTCDQEFLRIGHFNCPLCRGINVTREELDHAMGVAIDTVAETSGADGLGAFRSALKIQRAPELTQIFHGKDTIINQQPVSQDLVFFGMNNDLFQATSILLPTLNLPGLTTYARAAIRTGKLWMLQWVIAEMESRQAFPLREEVERWLHAAGKLQNKGEEFIALKEWLEQNYQTPHRVLKPWRQWQSRNALNSEQ